MNAEEIREFVEQEGGKIIYDYIRGSRVYGLNTETSDTDTSFVYIAPYKEIIGLRSNYKEQISDDKSDSVGYEVGRYLELLEKSNPNMLESLFISSDFVLSQNPIMKLILDHKNDFLSKNALRSLSGYAYDQINKAVGLNKKCVQPVMEKKTPIDFCRTFKGQGEQDMIHFLNERGLRQKYCGLVHISGMNQAYGVYYDWGQHIHSEWKTEGDFLEYYHAYITGTESPFIDNLIKYGLTDYPYIPVGEIYKAVTPKGYHGIQKEDETSNQIRLDSVLENEVPICHMIYNSDGYENYCRKYREYKDWIKNRNEVRYKNNLGHNYDSKNMMHCIRLLTMAIELGKDGKFILDRNKAGDKDYLMSIRNHKFSYKEIKVKADQLKKEVDQLIETSSLPDKVDHDMVNNLLIEIRNKAYE